jgi:hypothetical protein
VPCFSSLAEVREYLRAFKRAATEGRKKTEIWDRTKNRDALPDLGLSEKQRDDIILGLQVEHYCAGPMRDDDSERGGDVWIFGTEVHGTLVYVKLKLVGVEPLRRAMCLSFHRAEHPMNFPFKS